jgi:hypothetical protein
MRQALNSKRTCTANAAVHTALRSARVARFLATRNAAKPFPIPL